MPGGINSSGINSIGISEGGASNNTPGTSGFSNITEAPAQLLLATDLVPEPIAQEIQQPYILNGLTYKSNNPYIIDRDGAGNIKLQESASNQRLIIEPSIENITNQSFVEVVDTQFKYFKFPVRVTSTGTEGLDIDLPNFRYDVYEGRLLKDGDTLWIIKDNLKRLFYIKADSTWAIKNRLPPFANIAGDIGGKEKGEDNWFSTTDGIETGYDNKTYTITAPSVIASYKEGPAYTWLDTFPDGEDRYSKFHYSVTNFDSLGGTNIYINGRDFSPAEFSQAALGNQQPQTRFSEFNTDDTKDSYLGFNVQTPSGWIDSWGLKDPQDIHIYKQDSTTDSNWNYYVVSTTIHVIRVGGTHMTLNVDGDGVDLNMTPFLVDGDGIKSGTPVVTFPAPGGGDYGGWVLRIPELIERLKTKNPNKIVTLSNGNEQIKGNVGIRFNLQFPESGLPNAPQTRTVYFEYRIKKDQNNRVKEVVGDFHTSWYDGDSNRTYSDIDANWNSDNNAGGWGWSKIIEPINANLESYSL